MRGRGSGGPRERAQAARGFRAPRTESEEERFLEAALQASLEEEVPTVAAGPPAPAASGSAGSDEWVLVDEPEPEVAPDAHIRELRETLERLNLEIKAETAAQRQARWREDTAARFAEVQEEAQRLRSGPVFGLERYEDFRLAEDWRIYAVWNIAGDYRYSGLHAGCGTLAYEGLLRLANDRYSDLVFRRAYSLAEAIQLYEARRASDARGAQARRRLFLW